MSVLFAGAFTDFTIVLKAPRNTMYKITGIQYMLQTAVQNKTAIYDREIKSPTGAPIESTNTVDGIIANFTNNFVGQSFVDNINETVKHITIAKDSNSNVDSRVIIYGDIVKASRKDLIVEWFRKA